MKVSQMSVNGHFLF